MVEGARRSSAPPPALSVVPWPHQRSVTAYKVPLPLAEKANKPSSSWGFDDSVPGSNRAYLLRNPGLTPRADRSRALTGPIELEAEANTENRFVVFYAPLAIIYFE